MLSSVNKLWDGTGSLTAFVVSLNLHRRHLSESQRAMIGAHIKPMFEKEAKERQSLAGGDRKSVSANLREAVPQPRKSSEQAAEAVNVSPRSVESASKVLRDGIPELVAAVVAGSNTPLHYFRTSGNRPRLKKNWWSKFALRTLLSHASHGAHELTPDT